MPLRWPTLIDLIVCSGPRYLLLSPLIAPELALTSRRLTCLATHREHAAPNHRTEDSLTQSPHPTTLAPARVFLQEELFGSEEYRQIVAYHDSLARHHLCKAQTYRDHAKARDGLQLPLFSEDDGEVGGDMKDG